MKKLFLTIVMAVITLSAINAQEIKFGAKGGLNLAFMTGESTKDGSAITSFHVGAVAELELSDKFALQPELIYSVQGANEEEVYTNPILNINGKYSSKTILEYLNLPIMAKYFVTENLSIELGPQVGFLTSAKRKTEGTGTLLGQNVTRSESENIKDQMKSTDFGLGFGASYRLDSGLSIGARYNLGLSNISDTSNEKVSDNTEYKNAVVQFSIGYFF